MDKEPTGQPKQPTVSDLYNSLSSNDPNDPKVVIALSALYGSGRSNEDLVTPEMLEAIIADFREDPVRGLLNQNQLLLAIGAAMGGVKDDSGVFGGIKRDSADLVRRIYANLTVEQAESFGVPHCTLLKQGDLSVVILSKYPTDGYTVEGGSLREILVVRKEKGAGVLYYQSNKDGSADNVFGSFTMEDYEGVKPNVEVLSPEADQKLLERLLAEAAGQMESEKPRFMYRPEDCSPRPNYMRKEEWPKIAQFCRNSIPKADQ